ncbi:MAG: hypothetical protein AB7G23_03045 [Vicinamibacterales bacterium]
MSSRSSLALLLVVLLPARVLAQTCNVDPQSYPAAVSDARSAALTARLLASVQHIAPIDGRVCVAWGGMSSARIVGQDIRAAINQGQAGWSPLVKFANVASSGDTIGFWDEPTDVAWEQMATRLGGSGCTHAQVQAMALWLVETQPTGDPAAGTFSRAQYDAVVATAFAQFPNLRYLEVSGHPFTGYSVGTTYADKVPEPFVHADNARLAGWVETTVPPVAYRTYWSQATIPHPEHGFVTACSHVRSDGHHPSTFGTAGQDDGGGDRQWAMSALTRWAADPVWAFLSTGYGLPYEGDPPPVTSAPFSGTVTLDEGVCTLDGDAPSGAPVSVTVPVGVCDGL